MKREIKFRAWYKDEQFKFVELTSYKDGSLGINIARTGFSDLVTAPDETILEQFTGLKDRNGVDIYEGDLLTCDNLVIEIQYSANCFEGKYIKPKNLFSPLQNKNYLQWEVKGNIHENKDLL